MFFVATAAPDAHVNVSPRGLDTFRVLGPRRVAWLDLTGSGVETIAHLRADGRITLMFCAFEGMPKILRLYGTGRGTRTGRRRIRRAALPLPRPARRTRDHRRIRGPDRRLVRVRRTAHGPRRYPGPAPDLRRAQRSREDGRVQEAQELPEHRRPAGPGSRTCRDYQTSQSRRAGVSPTIVVRWSDGRRTFPSQK